MQNTRVSEWNEKNYSSESTVQEQYQEQFRNVTEWILKKSKI